MRLPALLSPRVLIHVLLLRPVLKLLFGVGVEGREHLREADRFMIVANHNSHLDVFLLFHVLPPGRIDRTHPVAAFEYFSRWTPVFRLVDWLFQPVWIVRDAAEGDPLEGMRARLRQGHSLIIFPEGTRGEPGALARFRTGVGRIAAEFRDVPAIPVFLAGPERGLPRSTPLPVPIWNRVVVGPPRTFGGTAEATAGALQAAVEELAETEMGARHRRAERPREPPTVAVLGIDGSGKSTLSRNLARHLSREVDACLVTDDVVFFRGGEEKEMRPLLTEKVREAIGRRAKTAASLKHYKVPKLVELLLRDRVAGELRRWYAPGVVVLDGSPLLNATAWAMLYREDLFDEALCAAGLRILTGDDEGIPKDDPIYASFPELVALKRLRLTNLAMPDVVLFLDVEPAVCMERIRSRGEERQAHETEERLAKLRDGYRTVCRVLERDRGIPARTLDGTGTVDDVTRAALDVVRGELEANRPRAGGNLAHIHAPDAGGGGPRGDAEGDAPGGVGTGPSAQGPVREGADG